MVRLRAKGGPLRARERLRAAATITRRMPSINQLVRKGRVKPKKKVSTPGL
jgi:hypothetical protein